MPKSSSLLYYTLFITIGFLYPAYCSLLALETPDKKDDKTWLVYWIVFAVFNLVEVVADQLLFWFPLYPVCKLGFLLWCTIPIGGNGAVWVYKGFLAPFIRMYGGHISSALTQAVDLAQQGAKYIPYP